MPTIEEGFSIHGTDGVKREERTRAYRVSDAELNRFLSLRIAAGFTYDKVGSTSSTTFYRKNDIRYGQTGPNTYLIYDASIGIRKLGAPMGGGHLVVLRIVNKSGNIHAFVNDAFNDIFEKINGIFSHAGADRTYTGNKWSYFYSYSFDLEDNYGFTITPAEPEDREAGNINAKKEDNIAIYLWKGSISPDFLNISIGIWDISKTGYENL
jgi:hypothetical protein